MFLLPTTNEPLNSMPIQQISKLQSLDSYEWAHDPCMHFATTHM